MTQYLDLLKSGDMGYMWLLILTDALKAVTLVAVTFYALLFLAHMGRRYQLRTRRGGVSAAKRDLGTRSRDDRQ